MSFKSPAATAHHIPRRMRFSNAHCDPTYAHARGHARGTGFNPAIHPCRRGSIACAAILTREPIRRLGSTWSSLALWKRCDTVKGARATAGTPAIRLFAKNPFREVLTDDPSFLSWSNEKSAIGESVYSDHSVGILTIYYQFITEIWDVFL